MSQELKAFYQAILAWINDGAPSNNWCGFREGSGLCTNVRRWIFETRQDLDFCEQSELGAHLQSEMRYQFIKAGVDLTYLRWGPCRAFRRQSLQVQQPTTPRLDQGARRVTTTPHTLNQAKQHYFAPINGERILVLLTHEDQWVSRLGNLYMVFAADDSITETNATAGTDEYAKLEDAYRLYIHMHRTP